MLAGYVTFAPAERIAEVCFSLLKSPAARWEMEQKGVQFMIQDNYQVSAASTNEQENVCGSSSSGSCVTMDIVQQPSSLALLAKALNRLAGIANVLRLCTGSVRVFLLNTVVVVLTPSLILFSLMCGSDVVACNE